MFLLDKYKVENVKNRVRPRLSGELSCIHFLTPEPENLGYPLNSAIYWTQIWNTYVCLEDVALLGRILPFHNSIAPAVQNDRKHDNAREAHGNGLIVTHHRK
jgi:hypothetical protein